MLGIAVGCIGMSIEDFCRCTPLEFESIYNAWHEHEESVIQEEWERVRLATTILLQPNSKKRLYPKDVMKLPWDTEKRLSVVDKDEARKRFEKIMKKD